MYWDVKTVKALSNYRIYVEIEDGRKDIFDVKPYLDHGVFRELRDVYYFNRVGILFGAVTWPHDQDIAPETLLAKMIAAEVTPEGTHKGDEPQSAHP
jgi:hypothetical protein